MALKYEKIVSEDINVGTGSVNVSAPGGGSLASTQVGIHTLGVDQAASTATWNPGSIASGGYEAKDVTVQGAALGDFVLVSFSLDVQDMTLTAQVTAANTVTATLSNNTGSAVDLGSGTLKVLVMKSA